MDIPNNDDGLKWFGEGFDGFPKSLTEDTVQYTIHTLEATQNQQKTASKLKLVQQRLKTLCKDLLKDYIWQRDAFNVELVFKDSQW
jgi:hypothetical protein